MAPVCRSYVIMVVALCTVSLCGTKTAHAVVCDGIVLYELQGVCRGGVGEGITHRVARSGSSVAVVFACVLNTASGCRSG